MITIKDLKEIHPLNIQTRKRKKKKRIKKIHRYLSIILISSALKFIKK